MMWWRNPFAGLAEHIATGKRGERNAEKYLCRCGYKMLDRNVRVGRHDEIDLVAYDSRENVLVFVEVKARSIAADDRHPLANFTYKKRMAFQRAVRRWVAQREYEGGYRMDIICVVGGTITDHIKEVGWL